MQPNDRGEPNPRRTLGDQENPAIADASHFQQLLQWLELESAAEAQRFASRRQASDADAEQSGETLLDLVIADDEPGLGGRWVLKLTKRGMARLPWTRLRIGSPVTLASETGEVVHGVVSARSNTSIDVSVNAWPEGSRFRVDSSPDEITRMRQKAALQELREARGRTSQLCRILLGQQAPRFLPSPECAYQAALNPSQQEAVRFGLAAQDLAIIHGPPGTGKTTTVVELICQAVARGDKVLACAPSNTAVDNLLERLIAAQQRVVRLGHPARVDARLRDATLDVQVTKDDLMDVVRDMLREAETLLRKAARYTRAKPAPGEKQQMRRDARQLKTDAKMLEQQVVRAVLDQADVVCATTSLNDDLLGSRRFGLAVIDEAGQSTEPGCWIPVLRADRIVLAGDHLQLPPTVLSPQAAREGFQTSMLERLVQHYGETVTRQLDIQYRMHRQIMNFSAEQFYGGRLRADPSVASHLLHDLSHVEPSPLASEPVTFIDTAGADWDEQLEPDGESRWNPHEAALILRKLEQLQAAGVKPEEMAVITPYAAQVRWLRAQSGCDQIEIDTVDGFQGREKEAVLISCVRSNAKREIGFLADIRRMNVALTRARRRLIVVGDSATLGGHDFYDKLLGYFESVGAYHSVWEEPLDLPA